MSDLVAFLNARLDEDEAAAKAAWPGPWSYETETGGFGPVGWVRVPFGPGAPNAYTGLTSFTPLGTTDAETCAHIARHDPARVLREVEAKRRILLEYRTTVADLDTSAPLERRTGFRYALSFVVKQMATVYSDHPDYDPGWKCD